MQKIMMALLLQLAVSTLMAQSPSFQLSTHILDIQTGKPAVDVKISLYKQNEQQQWVLVDEKMTDKQGRIKEFLKQEGKPHRGIYKLTFHTQPYFGKMNIDSFFPFVEVAFRLSDDTHYHVPLTLSPYGYSTYRGS